MSKIRFFLKQICIICCLVCLSARVLDWYNPYMDFSGHIIGVQLVLYIGCLSFCLCGRPQGKRNNRKRGKRNEEKNNYICGSML